MPNFCGLSIHISRRKSSALSEPETQVAMRTPSPPRPSREDGPFGLPAERPYPPVRSPLRHHRSARDHRSPSPRRGASAGPGSDRRYPDIIAPVPLAPGLRHYYPPTTEELDNSAGRQYLRRVPSPFPTTHISSCLAQQNSERPSYEPFSPRSPLSSVERLLWESPPSNSVNMPRQRPQRRQREAGPSSPLTIQRQEITLPNSPRRAPEVALSPVAWDRQGAPCHFPSGDEPIYFVPVSLGPSSSRRQARECNSPRDI